MANKHDKNIKITVTDNGTLKQTTKDINNLNKAQQKNNKSSQGLDRNMKGNARMSSNASKNFSKQAQGMNGVLVPAYAEVAARVFALSAAFSALSRAADYNILIKGQEAYALQTGKNMGSIAKSIQKASKHMLNFGEASKSAALASTAGISTKSITRMTKAALDASAALGRNMADSMDRLTRGIVKAEPEILDEIGIIIRLDRVYKDYAETIDKTTAQLTEFDKLQARTNAILGQAEQKFGGIADTLPANTFEKLSASVLDLSQSGGALLANFLTPLVDALAASSLTIGLFMASILKNLVGKMFPAFANFGSGFDKMTESITNFGNKTKGFGDSLATKLIGKKGELNKSRDLFGKGFEQLGKSAGSDLDAFMAKGFKKGKALSASIRRSIAVTLGAGLASATRNGGVSSVGRTKGMDRAQLSALRKEFNNITKLQDEIGKSRWATSIAGGAAYATSAVSKLAAGIATTIGSFGTLVGAVAGATKSLGGFRVASLGIGAAFKEKITFNRDLVPQGLLTQLDSINSNLVKMKQGWREVSASSGRAGKKLLVTNSVLWATKAALGGVVTVAAALVNMLGKLTAVVGGFMMLEWVAGWFLDLDANMGKLHASLDGVLESLEAVDKTIGARIGSDKEFYAKISIDFTDILDAKEFKANLVDQISQSLDQAMSDIQKNRASSSWWGKFMDTLYDITPFAASSKDKMASAISSSITQSMYTVGKDTKEFSNVWTVLQESLKDEDGRFGTFGAKRFSEELDAIKDGTVLTKAQVLELRESMQDALSGLSAEKVEKIYANLGSSLRAIQVDTAKSNKDFAALGGSLGEINKEIDSILKLSISTTDFDSMVEQYETALVNMKDSTTDATEQFSAIFESGLTKLIDKGSFSKEFADLLAAYSKEDAARKSILTRIKTAEKSFNTKAADTAKDELAKVSEIMHTYAKSLGETIQGSGGISAVLGFDPIEAQYRVRNLARELEDLNLVLVDLKMFGDSGLREVADINVSLLEKERAILQDHLELARIKLEVEKSGTPEYEKRLDTYSRIEANISNITIKMEQASRTSVAWSTHLHDIAGTTYLLSQRFRDMAKDGAGGKVFDRFQVDEVTKAWNDFNNSLNDTFSEEQKILKITDDIKLKFGELTSKDLVSNFAKTFRKAFPSEKYFKDTYKWILLSQTAIGKTITSRHEVLNKEQVHRDLEVQHFDKYEDLLDLRKTIADYELEMAGAKFDLIKKELIIAEVLSEKNKTELDIKTAKWEESIKWLAEAFAGVSSSFASAIGGFMSDAFMGKELQSGNLLEGISQGLADSAGGIIGNMANQMTFGNEGLLAKAGKSMGVGDKTLGMLFPKTDLEKLDARHVELTKLLAEISTNTGSTSTFTGALASNTSPEQFTKWMEDNYGDKADRTGQPYETLDNPATKPVTDKLVVTNNPIAVQDATKTDSMSILDSVAELVKTALAALKGTFGGSEKTIEAFKTVISPVIDELENQKNFLGNALDRITKETEKSATILKEEQGPNSFAVYDHGANTLLEKLDGKLTGTKGQFAEFKKGMSLEEQRRANLNAKRMPSTKEWLKDFDGKGKTTPKSVGAHATNSGFSEKNPYPRRAYHSNVTGENKMFRGTPDKGFTKGWNPAGAPAASDINRYNELMKSGERGVVTKAAVPITTATESVSIWSKLAPVFEKLNTALLMLMPNDNIMDTKTEMESLSDLPKGMSGALKVQEVDPKVPGGNGIPIPTTSITGDATTNKLSADLRGSMASNLQSQIMNDNLNAKALITNSLSTVGSNLMGSAINSMFGFANGGVATGGFRAFANGGTVTKPTLGLVGEGRYNEAVVPLPDGKSIPVIGAGGNSGDNNITVNVTVDSNGNAKSDTQSGMDGDQAKQLGYMISQAVQAELVEQQRHGGLLSSY